jgi:hypothetical protein
LAARNRGAGTGKAGEEPCPEELRKRRPCSTHGLALLRTSPLRIVESSPDELPFILPSKPANPDKYNELCDAAFIIDDDPERARRLRIEYHLAELEQLEAAWSAQSQAAPLSAPARNQWTDEQRHRGWIGRVEFAHYLGFSTRTVDTHLAEGRVDDAYKTDPDKPNSHWRIELDVAEAYKKKLKRRPMARAKRSPVGKHAPGVWKRETGRGDRYDFKHPDGRIKGGYTNLKEARAARAKMQADASIGAWRPPSTLTLREYAERWLARRKPGATTTSDGRLERQRLSPATFEGYDLNIKRHVLPVLGNARCQRSEPTTSTI